MALTMLKQEEVDPCGRDTYELPLQQTLDPLMKPVCSTSSGSSKGHMICVVCGDAATGRHYGTVACNGCKGFFRRTIRRQYSYKCRFKDDCDIKIHTRAVCRACRYRRCLENGMKIEAVQNERDVIGKRKRGTDSPEPQASASDRKQQMVSYEGISMNNMMSCADLTDDEIWSGRSSAALLQQLSNLEECVAKQRDSVIQSTGNVEYATSRQPNHFDGSKRQATVQDIFQSLRCQLVLGMNWARQLTPFNNLNNDDQTALLKSFAPQNIVLGVAYRSMSQRVDHLKLINDSFITRAADDKDEAPDEFYKKDCNRVMDQLVIPMSELDIDRIEFLAMKACVLFNPVAKGISRQSYQKVLNTRRAIYKALEFYENTKIPKPAEGRIGDILFTMLSPLQTFANMVSEDVLVTKLSGVAHLDRLMEELILAGSGPNYNGRSSRDDPKDTRQAAENIQRSLSESSYERSPVDTKTLESGTIPMDPSEDRRQSVSDHAPVRMFDNYTFTSPTMMDDYNSSSTLSSYFFQQPLNQNRPSVPTTTTYMTSPTPFTSTWDSSGSYMPPQTSMQPPVSTVDPRYVVNGNF
ncbi:hypothetical protein L596_020643 [Steinernema carpocapsae]|uniref:Nuclear receptor domain-containing protein n=1 Tax=Steinernema carpocapsae TaxID=34508 RepID=A0A4U5MU56_STECR|nr:hypothetical protein L596_020643 [Steinernema carpocapsae]